MPPHHFDEVCIALGGPYGSDMANEPDQDTGDPELQAKPNRSSDRAVEDSDGARRAGQKDRFSQRTVNPGAKRSLGLERRFIGEPSVTSAPPPNWKKLRKKELAANAIEMPKTIWIRRRNPPEESPKASVSPVMMMMITAMILATGPSMDSRIACSGASHGMEEPAA
jgi:hypothetical protein